MFFDDEDYSHDDMFEPDCASDYLPDYTSWDYAEKQAAAAHQLYEENNFEAAIAAIDKAIEINPDNEAWHFNKALALDAMERFDEAIEEYKIADSIKPDDTEILNSLAIDYTRSGLYDLSIEIFEKIQKIDPTFEPSYCNRIITYAEMDMHDAAEQMFYMAQQINADCPLCFYNIGNSLFIRGRYEKALGCWKKTAVLEPAHPQINFRIAQALWAMERTEQARDHFLAELRNNPGDVDVIFNFALFELDNENITDAQEKFKRVIELAPDYAAAWQYLGEIQMHKNNLDAAEKMFCKAMNLNSSTCGIRYRLAQIAMDKNQNQKAFELLKQELELDALGPEALSSIGQMMAKLGKEKFATHCFLEANSEDKPIAANYCNLGKILANQGYFEDAQQFLDYALQLAEDDIEIIASAAKVHAAAGNFDQAAKIIKNTTPAIRRSTKIRKIDRYIKVRMMRRKIKQTVAGIARHCCE